MTTGTQKEQLMDYPRCFLRTAPTGNRTQGKCLEGIYVTTTPLALVDVRIFLFVLCGKGASASATQKRAESGGREGANGHAITHEVYHALLARTYPPSG